MTAVLSFAILCTTVSAETLPSALIQAVESNPQLSAARSALQAVTEEVDVARGGYRPTLAAYASATQSDVDDENIGLGKIGVQLDQALYNGGATRSAVGSAKAQVLSAEAEVALTTQQVLLSAVSAYADVFRDSELARVRESNLAFLTEQVTVSQQRFDIGDDTKTAVSLAQAQEAAASARLAAAKAQLESSRASFQEIVGSAPGNLTAASVPLSKLPTTLDNASALNNATHPALIQVQQVARSAAFRIEQSRSTMRPDLNLSARLERVQDDLPVEDLRRQDGTTALLSLQLRVPIYQAGQASARLRQSRDILNQRELELQATQRQIRTQIHTAWHQFVAAQLASVANTRQITAAHFARDGKVNEQTVGLASTQDVLLAQQAVLDAQVAIAQTSRDELVAAYSLLSATGQLSLDTLGMRVRP